MSDFLILCPKKNSWGMSSEEFSSKLRERWSNVEIAIAKTPNIALDWSVRFESDYDLAGYLNQDGITVGIEGSSLEKFALFACWYRSIVPAEIPLIMIDQGYTTIYPLTAETTPEDIISGRIATEPPEEA